MEFPKKNNFIFILYKEGSIYDAIPNDILRRAMGMSKYVKVKILLISCIYKYIEYVKEYCEGYNIEIEAKELNKVNKIDYINNTFITHSWPETLYNVSSIFNIKNLIIIEEVPPLYDRLKKQSVKQLMRNRILTFPTMLRFLTLKYRKTLKKAHYYVAISDEEYTVLNNYYKLKPNFISYEPIDTRFFQYSRFSKRDSIIVFGNICNYDRFINILNKILKYIDIKRIICINSTNDNKYISNIPTYNISKYKLKDIQNIYSSALFSITMENRGSFELIPIEGVCSGVPVISPEVPSVKSLRNVFSTDSGFPVFNYFKFINIDSDEYLLNDFKKWFFNNDKNRAKFSERTLYNFSMENIAKEFLNNVKH